MRKMLPSLFILLVLSVPLAGCGLADDGKTIGTVEGTVTYRDGGTGELEIYMLKVEAATTAWPIIGFNLTR